MLIDDDEDDFINIRDLLREIKSLKYVITWKPSYHEGIKALQEKNHDVCLLDFRLGEHDGLQVLEDAKQISDTCPIILLTGFGDMELDLKAMQMGAADYLVKEKLTGLLLDRSMRYSFKRAQDTKELREQKENFKTLFNSTFEGIVVYKQGVIQDVNEATGYIFGCHAAEMLNHPLTDFIRADHREEFQKNILDTPDASIESIGVKKDGSEIHLLTSKREVNLQGQKTAIISIRDLTQRKQMEAQILRQDRLASLGLLASSLAHEIGTPLGVIRGRAQFIATKTKEENVKQDMGLVVSQIDRISKLVNSLLHIAREKKSSLSVAVNVTSVLEDVTRLIHHELERNSIKLKITCNPDEFVQAEPGPLGQVFLNLLVNSVHAIDEAKKNGKGIEHKVSISVSEENNEKIISIHDTGSGIEEKNLKHLFKPFFTTKDIGLGTGLGLATSYKLVQSWNGWMDVTSKVGQGTTFKIHLKKPSNKT